MRRSNNLFFSEDTPGRNSSNKGRLSIFFLASSLERIRRRFQRIVQLDEMFSELQRSILEADFNGFFRGDSTTFVKQIDILQQVQHVNKWDEHYGFDDSSQDNHSWRSDRSSHSKGALLEGEVSTVGCYLKWCLGGRQILPVYCMAILVDKCSC